MKESGAQSLQTIESFNILKNIILDIFNIVTAAVALASGIAAVTPTPKDDEWVAKAYKFLDMIALNVGLAKEKGE